MDLFRNDIPLSEKKITAEACIHHLWFSEEDYKTLGSKIKWNPAVKTAEDRKKLWEAVLDDRIDVLATDHAPHTLEEKQNPYTTCPSGGPLVQHVLPALMEKFLEGVIPLQTIVQKMAHNPAILFDIDRRGYLREGYFADLAVVSPDRPWKVEPENIHYKCGWSPFEGVEFRSRVLYTFVNGHPAYELGSFSDARHARRLTFDR
jgi:dihydroorotase